MKVYNSSSNPNPFYATADAAGLDLSVAESIKLERGLRTLVGTGIHVEIPKGFVGLLVPRSSLSKKYIFMTNSVGIIDADYRGEIFASLVYQPKSANEFVTLATGERIVQLIIVPYYKASIRIVESLEELEETDRGENGFGSTGI